MRNTVEIRLSSAKEAREFCQTVSRFPSGFELVSGKYAADAKSVMAVYSLDLSQPLTLNITSDLGDMAEILNDLKPYIVCS